MFLDRRFVASKNAIFTGPLVALLWAAAPVSAHPEGHLEALVEEVTPSVVTVLSSEDASQRASTERGTPFDDLFRQFNRPNGAPSPQNNQPKQGLGSGFILDEEGLIVTNHHVIEGADRVMVRLEDDREFEAEIVGFDAQTDLALLRIEAEDALPYMTLGNSDDLRVGESVFAVGNPFGLGGTVTSGIVSATGRDISTGPYAEFIQTDAAINRGNSGGPLINMEGEVVGVNSAIYSPTGGSVGLGFAVSSNIVSRVVADLKADGTVSRGWLGVSIQDVNQDFATALNLDKPTGALIASVSSDGPSHGVLKAGDVILNFNEKTVKNSSDLPRLVAAVSSGSTVPVDIIRAQERETVTVTIGALAREQVAELAKNDDAKPSVSEALGATVLALTPDARTQLGLVDEVKGVVVTSLETNGRASTAGLQVGDVIVQLGQELITSPDVLGEAVAAQENDTAMMLINRKGNQLFVAIKIA